MRYRQGDQWSARDANFVVEGVDRLLQTVGRNHATDTNLASSPTALPPYSCFTLGATDSVAYSSRPVVRVNLGDPVGITYTNGRSPVVVDAPFHAIPVTAIATELRVTGTVNPGSVCRPDANGAAVVGEGSLICVSDTSAGKALFVGSSSARTVLVPLTFTQTGGTDSYPATWTYTVENAITGAELGTAIDPTASPHLHQRPAVKLVAATGGIGYYNNSGNLVILSCNEMPSFEAC